MTAGHQPLTTAELLGLAGFWSAMALGGAILRQARPRRTIPGPFLPEAETVRFPASDGLAIAGARVAVRPGAPWILLCHGLRVPIPPTVAESLAEAGYNLLAVTCRGHRGSQGTLSSLGWREQRDLEGALSYLGRLADPPDRPLGLWGISTGATAAVLLAGRDERIGAVVADSLVASPAAYLAAEAARAFSLPPAVLRPPAVAVYRAIAGRGVTADRLRQALQQLGPRPLLAIHGSADRHSPSRRILSIYEGTPAVQVCMVEGAVHADAGFQDPAGYCRLITEFFDVSLQRRAAVASAPSTI